MLYFSNVKVKVLEKTLRNKTMSQAQQNIDHLFENIDFSIQELNFDRYENTTFKNCNFSDFSHVDFTDCTFETCNLSNVKFNNCKLDQVSFYGCKMVGAQFSQSKEFGFEIHAVECNLDYSSFDRKKLNKSSFEKCSFQESNLTQCDFSKAKLNQCDFKGALFDQTNLTGVDMRSCYQFQIDPTQNFIKKAKFRAQDLAGLLYRFNIIIS